MSVFLFTDIEGSTQLWEKHAERMGAILSRHDDIVHGQVKAHDGRIVKHTGDGVFAVFEAGQPLECALEVQRQIRLENWGPVGELRIRMALHAGEAERRGEDYFGPAVNRTARIMAAGWGGQILLTPEATSSSRLPSSARLEDLGVHLLKDLGEPQQIYGLVHPNLPLHSFPPLRSLSAHPNNLHIQPTPFIGRKTEIAGLVKWIEDSATRLVTVTGPGGVGKTRLALQAAAENVEPFPDGVYFVPLASVSSQDLIVSTIADSLGLTFYSQQDPRAQLLKHLSDKRMLLVLDNFEHLLDGTEIIAGILSSTPHVKVLATSRERLNLQGEWLFEVEGMDFPEDRESFDLGAYSAVELFVQSARRVASRFSLLEAEAPFVSRICQLVRGMPLGIELASAWVRVLSCREIAQEIEQSLDFLESSLRDVPARHRSLRAVFEYSWSMLSDDEKNVLSRMSVFRVGFSREAAQRVSGASLRLLSSLMDKSLLRRNASGRYELHEVLKQYAGQKLAENPQAQEDTHELHCSYYMEFVHNMQKDLFEAGQVQVLDEIRREIENIQVAWAWAADRRKVMEIHGVFHSLYRFYERRSWYLEGEAAFGRAAEALRDAPEVVSNPDGEKLLGMLIARQGAWCINLGQIEKGRRLLEESLSILRGIDAQREAVFPLVALARLADIQGRYEESERLEQESLAISRAVGNQRAVATILRNLAGKTGVSRTNIERKRLFEESLSINRQLGDLREISISLGALGIVTHELGESEKARQLLQESLALSRQIGDEMHEAEILTFLGSVSLDLGELEEARRLHQESLAIAKKIGNPVQTANSLDSLATTVGFLGEYAEARKLYVEGLAISQEIGYRLGVAFALNGLGIVASREGDYIQAKSLHEQSLSSHRQIGDPGGIANALNNLARDAFALGQYEESRAYIFESLHSAMQVEATPLVLEALVLMAALMTKDGNQEQALELLALSLNQPLIAKETRESAEGLVSELGSDLAPEVATTAWERGKARKLEDVVADTLRESQ
jgi:predicted ATPase/class 3 adenylate cyclase